MNPLKTRFFRHYKNKPYRYLGLVRHSETMEELALYETLYPNDLSKLWVRPKEMFFEDILVGGVKQPRFQAVEFTFKELHDVTDLSLEEVRLIQNDCFESEFNEKKFLDKLKDKEDILIIVAYDKDKLAGMKIGYANSADCFYSWLGGVRSEYRGLGVASELMRMQHEWCKRQGFKIIQTRALNEFTQMISLNLKNNFKITGTVTSPRGLKINLEKILS